MTPWRMLLLPLLGDGGKDLMDLDAKIGQLLMAGFRGLLAAPGDPVLRDVEQQRLGGVVLFDYDVPL